ncbi:MAG: tetratricopeptide repeat protein [Deltaproteobacteria bacterium]|nr:tetratricopeptide repeat protein [Deltaproteobacteria bacterium]
MRSFLAAPSSAALLLIALPACRKPADPAEAAARASEEADGLYVKATSEFLAGNQDEALKLLDACKALRPEDPRLPAAYGEVYLLMRKLKEARASFEEAVRRVPQRATNWTRLGTLQMLVGQDAEATQSFHTALERAPGDFNALEGLGEVALKAGRLDEAVKHLVAAADGAPEPARGPMLLRVADLLAEKQRAAEAALVLKEAVGRHATLPAQVHARLGELLVLSGDVEGARGAWEKAAELEPSLGNWEIVGELRLRAGQLDAAGEAFRNALLPGESAVIRVQLARLALRKGDRVAAELELEAALKAARGEEVRESLELAGLLEEMDRKPDALKLLAVISAEPDHAKDAALQLRVAKLARELENKVETEAACRRATAAGAAACP